MAGSRESCAKANLFGSVSGLRTRPSKEELQGMRDDSFEFGPTRGRVIANESRSPLLRFARLSAKWFVSECPVIRPKREATIETRSESGSTRVCQLPDLDSKVSGCP